MKTFVRALVAVAMSVGLFLPMEADALMQVADTIAEVYVDRDGWLAVRLAKGYATVSAECPAHNGWAGLPPTADRSLKAALLTAYASGRRVTLNLSGCAPNGAWLNIYAAYLQ